VSGDRVIEAHGYCSNVIADFIVAVVDDVAVQSAYVR
jgi:hypothetical protein